MIFYVVNVYESHNYNNNENNFSVLDFIKTIILFIAPLQQVERAQNEQELFAATISGGGSVSQENFKWLGRY